MENDPNNVWISREEYERLRQAQAVPLPVAAPAQPTPIKAIDASWLYVVKQINKISGVTAAVTFLMVLTGIAVNMGIGGFVFAVFAICLVVYLVTALIKIVTSMFAHKQHHSPLWWVLVASVTIGIAYCFQIFASIVIFFVGVGTGQIRGT